MSIEVAVVPDEDAFTGLCKCGYYTKAWPSQEIAAERILQHKAEHEGGLGEDGLAASPMEGKTAFVERHGLVINRDTARAVFPENAVIVGGDPEPEEEE